MRHRTDADKQLKGKCDEDPPSRVTVVAVVVPGFFDPGSLSVAQAGLALSHFNGFPVGTKARKWTLFEVTEQESPRSKGKSFGEHSPVSELVKVRT